MKMEKQVRYFLILSLQEMTLRRVAIFLWKQPDILALIGKLQVHQKYGDHKNKWRETVECKVSDKISKLQLPESLRKQMILILKPIGLQILRWKMYHEAYLSNSSENLDVPILEKLCWTATGTVDYGKTAEELVRCDVVDIVKRYKLACLYCLDHFIPEFWKELPLKYKTYFYDLSNCKLPSLQFCWPYILEGEEYKLDGIPERSSGNVATLNQDLFGTLSYVGNKTAVEYFFQKLSLEERRASLVSTALLALEVRYIRPRLYPWCFPKGNGSDVICYLLSLMTPEEQIRVFRGEAGRVLGCFLDWPLQDAFLDIADTMWTYMQCDNVGCRIRKYSALLDDMLERIQHSDYYSPTLYQNFFMRSPSDFRKHLVDRECNYGTFFTTLFSIHDAETINVILRCVDARDRVRLLSSEHILKHFYDFISSDRWNMVEMCIRDIGLSKEDKEELKEAFVGFLRRRDEGQIEWGAPRWRRFFEFLEETDGSAFSKRRLDKETLTETRKQFCEKENSTK